MSREPDPLVESASRRARSEIHRIIFEADTWGGKVFDVALITLIIASVLAVLLESVASIRAVWGPWLRAAEWAFTGFFTIEYALRLLSVREPLRYARSFYGLVDLLAVLPTYLSGLIPGGQSLIVIRALRLLRVFRVFKLGAFLTEANSLVIALRASGRKVGVFLSTILILILILGSMMYLIEGEDAGFTSIPRSIYWAIVTVTTVGYGDITPQSVPGQFLAAIAMVMGYAIIAVPTGIVTAELVQEVRAITTRTCPSCLTEGHQWSARFCRDCGDPLRDTRGEEPSGLDDL
ncbi:MAG: ion transporter [Myxococcales bacterium]|nr:ion transporter [Myxococcales bacterium]